jgi:glycosyltransferase involved in cell wall biosynthesis
MQIPVTVSARGNDLDQAIYPPGDFARLLWTLQRSTLISAVSQDFARKIQCLLGTTTPITVLPNAVDLEVFSPAPPDMELRKSLGIRDEEAVLVFSGELRHKKGAVHLLSSFRWVHAQRPACLLLVGEIRAREQELLTRFKLEAPEAAQRILLTGHLEQPGDVARHLRLADLFLLPALWDGLPNALVEAMACGCLVLGSDAGGLPELLRHDQNGCVLPRTELQHLGPAVLEALALHPERKIELCRQARLDVERDFSPRAEEAALNEFVQLLLK